MAETKIPFTKKSIRQIPASDLDLGNKGLELETQTDFYIGAGLGIDLTKCHGDTPDNTFTKMAFIFKDNAENAFYNSLLDSKQTQFELRFDKEKVFLMVGGFGNVIDKTKPEIQVYPAPSSRLMAVFFDPKFAGIITLESKAERERDKNGSDNPSQQEITNLKNELDQAKSDQEKLRKAITKSKKISEDILKKNSDLADSLKAAKSRLKDLEKTSSSDKGFWRKEVIIPIVLVLIVVIFIGVFFWVKKKKK